LADESAFPHAAAPRPAGRDGPRHPHAAQRRRPAGIAKISTGEAARRIGASRQTWENYENARSQAILRQDVQAQIAKALGLHPENLTEEYRRQLGEDAEAPRPNVAALQGGWPMPASGNVRQVIMPDDTLRPWASSGMTILFDRTQWPQPEHGVVLEDADGRRVVKIFAHADAEAFHVVELYPARKEIAFPRADFQAFRVVGRLG
jgi:transcriptional regulator with XRE-family HTH domain